MSMQDLVAATAGCHLCGDQLIDIDDYKFAHQVTSDCRPWRRSIRLAFCSGCGVVQKPVSDFWLRDIREIYAAYAVYEQGGGAEQTSFDADTGNAMARSQRIVAWLSKQGQLSDTGALLDVGCGNGSFMRVFGRSNPGWSMAGIELDARNRALVESLPGVTALHVGSIDSLSQGFDLIVMIHALEHIPNPIEFLKNVFKRLNPGGRLLIQVPNLLESPFDLLIVDHCSHFSSSSLNRVVSSAGYKVRQLDATCVAKELTLLAEPAGTEVPTDNRMSASNNDDACAAKRHVEWMYQVLRQGQEVFAGVGIFGTSVSGTWLASALGDRVQFFVDEDPNRIGRSHLGRPIFCPSEVDEEVDILMPMRPEVATAIAARLASHRLRLMIPPVLGLEKG